MSRGPTRLAALASPLILLLAVGLGGCGRDQPVVRDEAFEPSLQPLFGPLFAPGTEIEAENRCGLGDCRELAPWMSQAFLTCQAGPGGVYTEEFIACYGDEHARQLAAVKAAEQRLYARLPAAEAARLRAAQTAWAKAEADELRYRTDGLAGSLLSMGQVSIQLDYAVRRRIDLENRLGLAPGPPSGAGPRAPGPARG